MVRHPAYAFLAAGLGLAACAPVSVPVAERQCYDLIGPTRPITGEAAMGVTNEGFSSKLKVNLNVGGYTQGDPAAAFDRCVFNKSGQMPSRPYWDQPGAR